LFGKLLLGGFCAMRFCPFAFCNRFCRAWCTSSPCFGESSGISVFVWRCLLHVLPAVLVSHIRGCLQLGNLVSPSSYFLWVLQWFALLWRSLHIARLCPIFLLLWLLSPWSRSVTELAALSVSSLYSRRCYAG
jgi:hypothetical protein